MKKIFLFIILFCAKNITAQDRITFGYDESGNQKTRQYCFGCSARSINTAKEVSELEPNDLLKFYPEDELSFYPNPVKEQLFLKWKILSERKVNLIKLYSLDGRLLKSIYENENKNSEIIDFSSYPQNIYLISLVYSNGEEKSIKIIKKQ
jgi:hypothetical protein